jgi:hypothetical protein
LILAVHIGGEKTLDVGVGDRMSKRRGVADCACFDSARKAGSAIFRMHGSSPYRMNLPHTVGIGRMIGPFRYQRRRSAGGICVASIGPVKRDHVRQEHPRSYRMENVLTLICALIAFFRSIYGKNVNSH